jgi:hypothetical protein
VSGLVFGEFGATTVYDARDKSHFCLNFSGVTFGSVVGCRLSIEKRV